MRPLPLNGKASGFQGQYPLLGAGDTAQNQRHQGGKKRLCPHHQISLGLNASCPLGVHDGFAAGTQNVDHLQRVGEHISNLVIDAGFVHGSCQLLVGGRLEHPNENTGNVQNHKGKRNRRLKAFLINSQEVPPPDELSARHDEGLHHENQTHDQKNLLKRFRALFRLSAGRAQNDHDKKPGNQQQRKIMGRQLYGVENKAANGVHQNHPEFCQGVKSFQLIGFVDLDFFQICHNLSSFFVPYKTDSFAKSQESHLCFSLCHMGTLDSIR